MKKWSILLLCLLAAVALAACGSAQPSAQADDQLAVTVTFDAIKEFAEAVGGDQVAVSVIIPTGTEPHDFEPKAQDLVGLSSADVFIYNGLGMEAWVDDAVSAANNEKLVVVDASTGADAINPTHPPSHPDRDSGIMGFRSRYGCGAAPDSHRLPRFHQCMLKYGIRIAVYLKGTEDVNEKMWEDRLYRR